MNWEQVPRRPVEEVFKDFIARRRGIIRALTADFEAFYQRCDPAKDNLCLYGLSSGTWHLDEPIEDVPPVFPEPVLGINYSRDGMPEKDWLALIAVHADSWLLSLAFYYGARFRYDKADRARLFNLINDLPTVSEVVTSEQPQSSVTEVSSSQPRSSPKQGEEAAEEAEEEVDEDQGEETPCGACGVIYVAGEFWICCDMCETWFHGKCVKITPARAEHIDLYTCPFCSKRRPLRD